MDNYKEKFEKIYKNQGEAPWTFKEIPKELKELIETKKIKPGKVLEIGCGEGYAAIYLASKGFKVEALDRSKRAIGYAKEHAKEEGANCSFLIMDYKDIDKINKEFDFILDWRFLHEIIGEKERKKYVKNIHRLLANGGKYVSASFSGESDYWGTGKIRKAPTDIKLYFGKLENLKQLFEPYFEIIEMKLIKVPEKPDMEVDANYFFMEKGYEKK